MLERKIIKLRNKVIKRTKEFLNNKPKYVILDTETTGLRENDVLLQIGIIDLDGNILMDTLIKPTKKKSFDSTSTDIHGISMETVKDAPTFLSIYKDFKDVIGKKEVLIYNEPYDARIIEQTAEQDGFKLKSFNGTCNYL